MFQFSGMACFSPSVPSSTRGMWVKHGGSLTHNNEDFYNAKYFFCNGMDDPWLKELSSRSLIVRHALWVSASAAQQFLLPVAAFTLDCRFDLATMQSFFAPSRSGLSSPTSITKVEAIPLAPPLVLTEKKKNTKRALECYSEDEKHNHRPVKRTKVETAQMRQSKISDTSQRDVSSSSCPRTGLTLAEQRQIRHLIEPTINALEKVFAGIPLSEKGAACKSPVFHHVFGSKNSTLLDTSNVSISGPQASSSPKRTFDVLSLARIDRANKATFSVADLLCAPRIDATVFTLGHSYLSKTFRCKQPSVNKK